ncbi:uracil-DNA glycosylase family protein [Acetobacter sp. TBRC 12305]|uniref:Uracil-DNA glycosylase family protein n=1 Tax=Acetobacter garciniae TaxID=2817435 RepID=A0A939KPX7_9PROT|nr:uracil-DNA glycosylase family protein [Acetobacter garciniae]MBX0344268.1 uracil-DNA glycosylase family protein [Acetobacter garciniae]
MPSSPIPPAAVSATRAGPKQPACPLQDGLQPLVDAIRACSACAHKLPLGPRPVLHVSRHARLLIASQAPGTRVHETGISFNDASGDRLRTWLGMSRDEFYDTTRVALVPMAFCYPGVLPKGGDRPPPPECAALWRERLLAQLPAIRLTLLVGSYAQNHVLGKGPVFERSLQFQRYLPEYFPLPHPSWRTGQWERATPAFGQVVLPALRREIRRALEG